MTRQYEIVYIFDCALEQAAIDEKLELFHAQLKRPEHPEPVTAVSHWGKRTLAYPVQRKDVGYYVVAQFECEPSLLTELERVIKLDEAVLRHLVVVNDGLAPTPVAIGAEIERDDVADEDVEEEDDE